MSMRADLVGLIDRYQRGLHQVLTDLPIADVAAIIEVLEEAYDSGRHVFIVGNGGSAATASHLACDLSKTVLGQAPNPSARRFRVIALTDNVPLLSAYGNDVGYGSVFAEPLRNLANPGDVLIAISASGQSDNILAALRAAREIGMQTVGLLGFRGGAAAALSDRSVIIQSEHYGHIEDVHMILGHLMTEHFKQRFQAPAEAASATAAATPEAP